MLSVTIVASLLASALGVPAAYDPIYHFTGVLTLPYAGLQEDFETWTNGTEQRIDWYGGLDVDIATPSVSYQTFPVYTGSINKQWCLKFGGGSPIPLLVNMSSANGWKFVNTTILPGSKTDETVDHYQKLVKNENRVSTYDFFASPSDGMPIRLHMLGYDFVLGSHYDEYVIDYHGVALGPKAAKNATRFAPPGPDCGGYPPADPRSGGPGDSDDWQHRRVASPFGSVLSSLQEASAPASSPSTPGGWPQCDHPAVEALAGGSQEPVECAYERWAADHGRDVAAMQPQERARRLLRFRRALRVVSSHRRRGQHQAFDLRLTRLADWTEEERAALSGTQSPARAKAPSVPAAGAHPAPSEAELAALPARVDWTLVPNVVLPIQDQATCGSCWSFGAMGTIAGSQAIKHGSLTQMSHQSAMDCSWPEGNYGCDGGNDFLAYSWFLANGNGSVPTETTYGNYLGQDGHCHYFSSSVEMGAQIEAYYNVTSGSETALMSAVATKGPISISIDAALDTFDFYSSGVYDDPACKSGLDDLDHTVLLVGYGTSEAGQDYWKVKNSWSTHWGDDGYVLIARKNNICGVATQPTYVEVV